MTQQLLGQPLLDQLRADGYKVNVSHNRIPATERDIIEEMREDRNNWSHDAKVTFVRARSAPKYQLREAGEEILPFGGVTIVRVTKGDKEYVAISTCSPLDNFDKRQGLIRATGRLLGVMKKEKRVAH